MRERRYLWGNEAPVPLQANLDGSVIGVVDPTPCPAGDGAWDSTQIPGNVWE